MTLSYVNDRVTSFTDPVGRITHLFYDDFGNLSQIIDPDDSVQRWEYDSQHHLTREIDKRGNVSEAFYDFAGRATRAIRTDGTEVSINALQVQGLYAPDATIDPLSAPVAQTLGSPDATYADGNGNIIVNTLDQQGQTVSAIDSAGALPTVERNEDNLITQSQDGRGNITFLSYDDNGNLVGIRDELSGGNLISGNIAIPGEAIATSSH